MKPMYYIGLDVHKRKIGYCIKDSGGMVYAEGSLDENASLPLELLRVCVGIQLRCDPTRRFCG